MIKIDEAKDNLCIKGDTNAITNELAIVIYQFSKEIQTQKDIPIELATNAMFEIILQKVGNLISSNQTET